MDSQIKKSTKSRLNPFDQLPHETLLDILSRLPIKSLIQFSFTSKPLNSLTHLARSNASHPIIIIHADYPIINALHFLQFPDDKISRFKIPFANSMPEFSILGSSNGLLCLINTLFNESIVMYNPFTRDYFELPMNYDSRHQIVVHGFGFDPVYKVVKIAYHRSSRQGSEVEVYSRRCNMWLDRGAISYRLEQRSSPGVLVGQSLNWVSVWGKYDDGNHQRVIISYDVVNETFMAIKFGPGSLGNWATYSLAALNGCLCASVPVPSGCGSFDIWIMKDYGVESWVKRYSVGVYHPISTFTREMVRSPGIWRTMFEKRMVKVLCVLEGGEVVLEYRGGGLVVYDPWKKCFRELKYRGNAKEFSSHCSCW